MLGLRASQHFRMNEYFMQSTAYSPPGYLKLRSELSLAPQKALDSVCALALKCCPEEIGFRNRKHL